MPKYTFLCQKCGMTTQSRGAITLLHIKCSCGQDADRQMPKISKVKNTETIDKLSNKKHLVDQNEILKERKQDHFWMFEVPKMVDSGTYSIETMLEQGWVFFNEKGELTTRTKPPMKM